MSVEIDNPWVGAQVKYPPLTGDTFHRVVAVGLQHGCVTSLFLEGGNVITLHWGSK